MELRHEPTREMPPIRLECFTTDVSVALWVLPQPSNGMVMCISIIQIVGLGVSEVIIEPAVLFFILVEGG